MKNYLLASDEDPASQSKEPGYDLQQQARMTPMLISHETNLVTS